MNLLQKMFGPRKSYIPPLPDSEVEKQVVKERLLEAQQRLRAMSAEADVLSGNLGELIEEL